ncbi:hypothetical protein AX17_005375 [Amanita inopinata Kibby_2008]|nr:hypothetical protein AX17_005375 [Amanita inopinata Kibby_2008]
MLLTLVALNVWQLILDQLSSPLDLIHFGQTCKTAQTILSHYFERVFDLSRVLLPYFSLEDILSFRHLQISTGLLISGSTALQFFDRSPYPESDLDIYVENRYCRDVAQWLTSREYQFTSLRKSQPKDFKTAFLESIRAKSWSAPFATRDELGTREAYFGRGVSSVLNLSKPGSDRKIQLISATYPPLEIILNYHSTCVMNVITHEAAYALYPYTTFHQRRSLVCETDGTKQDKARQKYKDRGWSLVSFVKPRERKDQRSDFCAGMRWMGDHRCWKVTLTPVQDPLMKSPMPDYISSNSWGLKYGHNLNAIMEFAHLRTPGLRFCYLIADNYAQYFMLPRMHNRLDDRELNNLLHTSYQ